MSDPRCAPDIFAAEAEELAGIFAAEAEELAGPHLYVDEDRWYSCGLAFEPGEDPTPGSVCTDRERVGRCNCGRDTRVAMVKVALIKAYIAGMDRALQIAKETA